MITNQFKLSVSEARAWDEDHKSDYLPLTEGALNQLPTKHRRGWTPAPDTTQLRRYEPPAKHGRDMDSLIRYHEAHKKGRTDDDALKDKFGSGMAGARPASPVASSVQKIPVESPAPTPPQSGDEELYEPVGTMPIAGDRVRWAGEIITVSRIAEGEYFSVRFQRAGGTEDGLLVSYFSANDTMPLRILKRKPAAQVEGRAWKFPGNVFGELCVLMPDKDAYTFGLDPETKSRCWRSIGKRDPCTLGIELHGSEAAAVIEDCRKAMNLK